MFGHWMEENKRGKQKFWDLKEWKSIETQKDVILLSNIVLQNQNKYRRCLLLYGYVYVLLPKDIFFFLNEIFSTRSVFDFAILLPWFPHHGYRLKFCWWLKKYSVKSITGGLICQHSTNSANYVWHILLR